VIDEELPAELRELIAAERTRVPGPQLRGAVRAKLATSIAAGGATAASAAALKVLLVVALVGGAGAGVATFTHGRAAVASVPPPVWTMPASEPLPVQEADVAVDAAAALPRAGDVPAAVRPRAHTVVAVAVAAPPPSDAELLAAALRALSTRDAARALELAQQDASLYASSPLAEERDAIRIRALAALGRADEARPLAAAFIATHPHSIHRHLVENLQESP
jgi:hypothetical protein